MTTSVKGLFQLDGRKAFVVGGGSGLGRASALALAEFGAEVVIGDVNLEGAEETAALIVEAGGTASVMRVDVNDSASVDEAVAAHPDTFALVATPGINVRKRLLDTTDEEFDRVVSLNLKGTFRLLRGFGREMAARGRGSIVTFASFRALMVEPGQGVYAATKAGVLQMGRALAAELGPQGVRVNSLAPGPFETPLTEQIKADAGWYDAYADRTALKRWAQPHEIGGAVVFLASDASSFVTGTLQIVEGGWTAIDGRFEPRL